MTTVHDTMTEEQFDERFAPYRNENGDLFDFADVKDAPLNTVWTVVEAGDDWMAVPGFAVVNRLGYLKSNTPWTDADGIATYIAGDVEEDV